MYAAILHVSFPPTRHADVVRFLDEEMLPVIRASDGFREPTSERGTSEAEVNRMSWTSACSTRARPVSS
jgi:hypothetical protein